MIETRAASLYEPAPPSNEAPGNVSPAVAQRGTPARQNASTADGQIRFVLQGDDATELDRANQAIREALSQLQGVDIVATSDTDPRASILPPNHSVVARSLAGASLGTVVSGDHRTSVVIRPPRFVSAFDPLSAASSTTMPRALNINLAVEVHTERPAGDAAGVGVRRVVAFFVTPRRHHSRSWSDAVRRRITRLTLPDSCSIEWL